MLGETDRVVFAKRTNPSVAYSRGKFFAIGQERLRRLDEPAFSFSPGFDLVVSSSWAIVLNLTSFERLFRDIGIVDRHLTGWVQEITDHLPMSQSNADALTEVARRDSRTWRKLRDIQARGHLSSVTLDMVVEYAAEMGLDPAAIVKDGELVFDATDRFSFLHLLNEDLFRGALTSEAFEAQRKATAG